ncbi:13285_t:CDS:1, partial [Racocetra fulgida]
MGNRVKYGNKPLHYNQTYGCYWYDNSIAKLSPIKNASTSQDFLHDDYDGSPFSVDEYE